MREMKLIFSRQREFLRMLYQLKTGILFNINQSFLTTMHSIVTLCSMLIQDIIYWYYFPVTVNTLKCMTMTSCKTILMKDQKSKLSLQDKKTFLANILLNIESNSFKGKSIYLNNIAQQS